MSELRGHCGKCGGRFAGQMLCPVCNEQLSIKADGVAPSRVALPKIAHVPDGPSFARRMALGMIVSFGMSHGLKHATLAFILFFQGAAANELTLDHSAGMLLVSTFFAGVVAGTANRRAEAAGFLLGLIGAASVIVIDIARSQWPPEEWLIGLPILASLVGVIGGFVGRALYPPAPKLPRASGSNSKIEPEQPTIKESIGFFRILIGASIAIMGTVEASEIRAWLSKSLAGHGGGFGSSQFVTWQIGALSAAIGGIIAGSNRFRGVRQGVLVGILVGAGVAGSAISLGVGKVVAGEFWLDQLAISQESPLFPIAFGGSAAAIAAVGGWLGSQLLPPRAKKRRKRLD
jgi:hypothetical protein